MSQDYVKFAMMSAIMYVDPRDIVLCDRDEFYVEKILLAQHGDIGRLKTLAFHV